MNPVVAAFIALLEAFPYTPPWVKEALLVAAQLEPFYEQKTPGTLQFRPDDTNLSTVTIAHIKP